VTRQPGHGGARYIADQKAKGKSVTPQLAPTSMPTPLYAGTASATKSAPSATKAAPAAPAKK